MRTMSAELLAGQQASVHQPYVERLTLSSRRWGVGRLEHSNLHSEAVAGHLFTACVTPEGVVVRARVTAAGDVYTQRVDSPFAATASSWEGWTLLGAGIASAMVRPALVAEGSGVTLLLVKPNGYTLFRRYSGDGGRTWGTDLNIASDSAAPIRAVGATARTGSGTRLYVWACGPNVEGSAVVDLRYREHYSGGTLGTTSSFTLTKFWQVRDLAAVWTGDWHVIVTGQSGEAPNPWGVFLLVLGDGVQYATGAWHGIGTLERADSLSAYRYSSPSLSTLGSTYRCA